ncbi:methyl-accepting chemotaxis protein [Roseivivax sediminis]|uniref:Methyl-accepting chemotaxis sensory transducer with Pas/Pac sensor n=1 Tax=Roseivivax sediminis TaxID=936889 RepID=A0A1I2D164_9RHOB|nr:PAS domain-containing methyl-accepting chemotaxis protein [Roseivivax sediminis]SFE74249.1 methyl-accepting chemotaxis sensory transducer with Pas/Pac sensor [Roseivivax sediminis]
MGRFWPKTVPAPDGRAEQMEAVDRTHVLMRLDAGGTIVAANAAAHDALGYAEGGLEGLKFTDLLRPDDRRAPWLEQIVSRVRRGEDTFRITPVLSHSREERWLSLSFCRMPGEEGECLVVGRDVTDHHLRNRDNRGHVDATKLSMAVIEFDLDGHILDANDNFCRATGYRLDEIVGKHHRIFMPPEEAQSSAYLAFWERLSSGASENGQVRRISKSGEPLWLEATYETLRDGDGRPFKVVKYAFDITAAKNAASEAQSQIDAIQKVQAVIEFDPDGRILRANDLFCSVLGYELSEIVGRHHRIFLSEQEMSGDGYETFWRDLAAGKEASGDYLRIGKNGKRVHIRASYNPVYDASGRVTKIVKFAMDTTTFERTAEVMRQGLADLAAGRLSVELTQNLGELDEIRTNFNSAASKIRNVILQVVQQSSDVTAEAGAITSATHQLAQRTQHQAATLEESAAALQEITTSVESTAQSAMQAREQASESIDETGRSRRIVEKAMAAMDAISESSNKISSITSVIDDIAFQTNLLALNAGVEAARAGDAGRGFAVVASEVRALAQRSSDAAREIATLITESTEQVRSGVSLVGDTGSALTQIDTRVKEISDSIEKIAQTAQGQSGKIRDMNASVSTLDRATQQNAAMAEETSAGIETLERLVKQVHQELSYFDVVDDGDSHPRAKQGAYRARA